MKERKLSFITFTILVLSMMSTGMNHEVTIIPSANAQGNTGLLELSGTLSPQMGNDIYFTTTSDLVTTAFQTSFYGMGSNYHFSANGQYYGPYPNQYQNSVSAGQQRQFLGPDYLEQYHNTSSNFNNKLNFYGHAYDLTKAGMKNFRLINEENYLFKFNATAGQPLAFLIDTVSYAPFRITVITPSGDSFSYNRYIDVNYPTYYPFVPFETGDYVAYLSSTYDVTVKEFKIVDGFNIKMINSAESVDFKTKYSNVQFYMYAAENTTNMADLYARYATISSDYHDGSYNTNLRIFSQSGTNSFGSSGTSTSYSNTDIYVAVSIAVRNDPQSQNDAKVRNHYDYFDGASMTLYFTVRNSTVLQALPTGTDFFAPPEANSFSPMYYYKATQDQFIGLNGTVYGGSTYLVFSNMATGESYSYYTWQHDILNSYSDDLQLLPAGDYLVLAQDYAYLRVTPFIPKSLTNHQVTSSFKYRDIQIFKVSGIAPHYLMNSTYTTLANNSVSMYFSFFDSNGYYNTWDSYTFTNRKGASSSVYDNMTQSMYNIYDPNSSYVRVENTGNTVYNDTSNSLYDPIESNNPDESASFTFTFQDYLPYLQMNNPTSDYSQSSFTPSTSGSLMTDTYSRTLLDANTTAYHVMKITLNKAGGYYFNISAIDRGISNIYFQNQYNTLLSGYTLGVNSSTIIEFAVAEPTTYYLYGNGGAPTGKNGTLQLQTIFATPRTVSVPSIGLANKYQVPAIMNPTTPSQDRAAASTEKSPLSTVGVLFGLVTVVVMVRVVNKKKKILS